MYINENTTYPQVVLKKQKKIILLIDLRLTIHIQREHQFHMPCLANTSFQPIQIAFFK